MTLETPQTALLNLAPVPVNMARRAWLYPKGMLLSEGHAYTHVNTHIYTHVCTHVYTFLLIIPDASLMPPALGVITNTVCANNTLCAIANLCPCGDVRLMRGSVRSAHVDAVDVAGKPSLCGPHHRRRCSSQRWPWIRKAGRLRATGSRGQAC